MARQITLLLALAIAGCVTFEHPYYCDHRPMEAGCKAISLGRVTMPVQLP